MDEAEARSTARLAGATAGVAVGSAVCLATYFAVGGPFGTINDIGNATTAVLSAALAWNLRRRLPARARALALAPAIVGAAIAVVGSALVVSGTTGWYLAGLVSSVGFAGIGTWLVVINRGRDLSVALPRLRSLGVLGGALMIVGIAAVPGILLGLDDPDAAPAWAWLGSTAWLGIYIAYPAWALWLAVVEARRARSGRGSGALGDSTDSKEARSWTGG